MVVVEAGRTVKFYLKSSGGVTYTGFPNRLYGAPPGTIF